MVILIQINVWFVRLFFYNFATVLGHHLIYIIKSETIWAMLLYHANKYEKWIERLSLSSVHAHSQILDCNVIFVSFNSPCVLITGNESCLLQSMHCWITSFTHSTLFYRSLIYSFSCYCSEWLWINRTKQSPQGHWFTLF